MGKPILDNLNFKAVWFSDCAVLSFRLSKWISSAEYIGVKRRTRGTEISKYPEERTSTETPLVVASERGPGECNRKQKWNTLESVAAAGDSPVHVTACVRLE